MNFFEHQTQALRRTTLLVVLFILALLSLTAILNFMIAALFFGFGSEENVSIWSTIDAKQWFGISGLVITVVGLASLYRWLQLKGGGKKIALSLGGRLIDMNTSDFYERRLLNVIAEISLAASVPVPPVYLLDDNSINAFAAGYKSSDAVIGVTRGCMEKLSRDQLQGVIAHEFSHIFNGDMRLNIRIMAVLFGILFIGLLGRFLLEAASRSSRRSSKDNRAVAFLLLGIGLIIIGYCGVFFCNLIKAAVSRQREYLADASAVQFTRNPDGISGALKVIGYGEGSIINSPERDETAHLFFSDALPHKFMSLFSTHPPLDERIRRIDPQWKGSYDIAPQSKADALQAEEIAGFSGFTSAIQASINSNLVENRTDIQVSEAAQYLKKQVNEKESAALLMYALLLHRQNKISTIQVAVLKEQLTPHQINLLEHLSSYSLNMHDCERLPLVELAIPALKNMTDNEYKIFISNLEMLANADTKITVFEWCMLQLIQLYLNAHFKGPDRRFEKSATEKQLVGDISRVLSIIAYEDNEDPQAAFLAGCNAGGFDFQQIRRATSFTQLETSLHNLGRAYPHIKARILKAMQAAAARDGIIGTAERDLIKTMAAIIEIPTI